MTISPKLELEIKKLTVKKCLRLQLFFQDFDGLRSGLVTATQFCRCLAMLGIVLKDYEYQELIDEYKNEEGKIRYTLFLKEFQFEAQANLEKNPLEEVDFADKTLSLVKEKPNDTGKEFMIQELLKHVAKESKRLAFDLPDSYMDLDPLRSGKGYSHIPSFFEITLYSHHFKSKSNNFSIPAKFPNKNQRTFKEAAGSKIYGTRQFPSQLQIVCQRCIEIPKLKTNKYCTPK